MSATVRRIPNFVKARSAQALRVKMLEVNAKRGAVHVWTDIMWHPVEKIWYAWYYSEIDLDILTGDIIDG